ncbi:hypothetical protein T03_11460 [Trichinella britovi]|uniref:Uncharacterized protein n=1 Tax=Trichinella britovi TaxID=45882 RepID=A0A0V1D133_TRIBR|nr:hypothetical protein T03_11460 [Trichinella britovi]
MSEQSSSDPPRGRHSDYFLETFPAAENFLVRYDNNMLVDRDSFDIGNVIETNLHSFGFDVFRSVGMAVAHTGVVFLSIFCYGIGVLKQFIVFFDRILRMNPKKFVERLTKIRDNKRDVLNAIEKLKGKLGMIDKDKLQKLINLYDDLAKQEEEYLCIFRQVFPRKIGSSDSLPGAVASSNASQSPASLSPGQQKHAEVQDPKQCNILEARSKMQNLMEEQRLFQGFCNSIMSRMEQLQMELKEFEQPNVVSNESLVSHVQALKQLEEKLKMAKLLCAQTVEASKQNNSGNDIDTELADYAHKLRIRKQHFDDLSLRFAELEQFTDNVKSNGSERSSSSTWTRPPSNNDNKYIDMHINECAMEKTVSNDTRGGGGFKDKELSLTFPDSWLRNYDSKMKYSQKDGGLEGDSSRMDSYTKAFRDFERKYLLNDDETDATALKLHVNEGENSAGICSSDAGGGEQLANSSNNCRSSECRTADGAAGVGGGAGASVVTATIGGSGLSEKFTTDNLAKTIRRRIVEKLPLSGFKQSAQRHKGRIQHCNSSSSSSNMLINGGGGGTTTTTNNNNNNSSSKQLRYEIPTTNDSGGVAAVREEKLEKLKYYIDMIKKICDGMLEDAGDGCSHVPLTSGRAGRSEATGAELFSKNLCMGCAQQQQQHQSLLLAVLNCQQQIQIQQQMEFTMLRKWFENSNSFGRNVEECHGRRSSSEATATRQRFHANEQHQLSDERRRCFTRKNHPQRSRRMSGKGAAAESTSKHGRRVPSRLRRRIPCCLRQSPDDLESSGLSVTASGRLQSRGQTRRDVVVHDRGASDVSYANLGCCASGAGGDGAAAGAIGQPMTFSEFLFNNGQRYLSEEEELIPYGEYLHQNNNNSNTNVKEDKMDENNRIVSEKETKTPLKKCIPDLINAVISDAVHNVMPFTKEFFNDMVEIMLHNQRLFSRLLSLLYRSDASLEETKKSSNNVEEGVKKYDLDEIFKFGRDVVEEMFDEAVELFGNENGGVIFEKPHVEILLARIKQKLENECEPNLVDKGVIEHLELQLPKLYGKTISSCRKELRFIVQTIVVLWLKRRKLELDKLEPKEQHSPDVVMQMTTASFQPLSMSCGCENKLLVDDYAETGAVFFERKTNKQPHDKPSQDEDAEVAGPSSILEDVLGDWQLAEAENVVTNDGGVSMFSDSPDELLYELNIQKREAPSDKDESPGTGSFVSVDYVAVHPTRVRCTNTVTVQVPNNGQQAKSSVRLNEKKHDDEGNIIIHK